MPGLSGTQKSGLFGGEVNINGKMAVNIEGLVVQLQPEGGQCR